MSRRQFTAFWLAVLIFCGLFWAGIWELSTHLTMRVIGWSVIAVLITYLSTMTAILVADHRRQVAHQRVMEDRARARRAARLQEQRDLNFSRR